MRLSAPGIGTAARLCHFALGLLMTRSAPAQQVPHNQDRPPGPALSAEEARQKMTVPEGFRVEVFAAEPNIVNPVTMHFDERGRLWVAESLEYPRQSPGPGQDRIKIVEDSDGDGKADKFTIFADGLNIPSGVAVGNGGVYVANSPDILFFKDTDGDDHADVREVVLTGFGRFDTHEVPNTLTWGPDGWLYGLNGVFNPAVVQNQGKEHHFDAALWRYHPRTRAFELFAEGTSNPWGMAWDSEGNAFVSACVIDHLYHLSETGYYHRQAGAYPPHTWKIESVVNHSHQKAAYCSLAYYDADVYPEKYRGRLYMGNIHGSCINADRLERRGATYESSGEPDFLAANDAWFMPTAIRLGPDGCFYVLDWYDRYHCYQDANRDPGGIDRLRGRIYRIAYGTAATAGKVDLARESSDRLRQLLGHANLWWRDTARHVLSERIAQGGDPGSPRALKETVLDSSAPRKLRIHALWTLVSAENPGAHASWLDGDFFAALFKVEDTTLRAWAVRAAGASRKIDARTLAAIQQLAGDPAPDVQLQVATVARKLLPDREAITLLLDTLQASANDPIIPQIVWRNLEPLLETEGAHFAATAAARGTTGKGLNPILGRACRRLLLVRNKDLTPLATLAQTLVARRSGNPEPAQVCLDALAGAVAGGEVDDDGRAKLKAALAGEATTILAGPPTDSLRAPALILAASWKDPAALAESSRILLDSRARPEARSLALRAVAGSRDESALLGATAILRSGDPQPEELVRDVLASLGRSDSPRIASAVLEALPSLPLAARAQAIDLLTQRTGWATALLGAIDLKQVDRSALSLNQVRRLIALGDETVGRRVQEIWGSVRSERNPQREQVIARVRKSLEAAPGNPWNGKAVFEKTCAKCHTIFGKGANVGPDITVNGRETLDAVLTNLLDPNLVIGKGYQAWTLATTDGRVLSGLLVEESPQRVVLRVEGGKEEAVARADIMTFEQSKISLMPEELEKTISEQELRDLVVFLRFEEPPPEPVETVHAPGTPALKAEQTYGTVVVKAAAGELLRFEHSKDQRPYLHPLRVAPAGAVLTALRPDDHPWQYGVFTGHARLSGVDFWHEKGWIRSRGLESVKELGPAVEIVARNDWLDQRRGGKRLLVERQRIVVHAPEAATPGLYAIDFNWELTPEVELTVGQYDYGGLAFRPADHRERKHVHGDGDSAWAWQDMSGVFTHEGKPVEAGVAIFDHPKNPGYPPVWRVDGQGLINPAITARGPLILPAGKPALFRYRLVVHAGAGKVPELQALHDAWKALPLETGR